MLFHEVYGCYYHVVADILAEAVMGELTQERMTKIIEEKAFGESFLTILPALAKEEWQLLESSLNTPLKHKPQMSLTELQRRWLKAVSLDERIRLFDVNTDFLEGIKPLFTSEDYVVFDKYSDGDDYGDEGYIKAFRTVLEAIQKQKKVTIEYMSSKGHAGRIICDPWKLEYSEKDDKFRVRIGSCRFANVLNMGGICKCEIISDASMKSRDGSEPYSEFVIMELIDERNALERVMLHFAHFKKEAERLSENTYRLKVFYDEEDRTEMVIRVMSFGPFLKVTEPESFTNLIKDRLIKQKSCGLL